MKTLEQCLLEYDGVAVPPLSEAQMSCQEAPNYCDDLVDLCFDPRPSISGGATWILKAELDAGMVLSEEHKDRIVNNLPSIEAWQAALHLLQTVEALNLTALQAAKFLSWAPNYADHSRPFLRAWSLHARVVLSTKFPKHGCNIQQALAVADEDVAASVRARSRKLRGIAGRPQHSRRKIK